MTLNRLALRLQDFDAVLVDLDGTLVDTLGDFVAALNLTLAGLSCPAVTHDQVARWIGKGSEHLVKMAIMSEELTQADTNNVADMPIKKSILRQTKGPHADFDTALAAYQRHYKTVNGRHSAVYPGAEPGLRHLRGLNNQAGQGLKLACLTNKPTTFANELLQAKGLAAYFDAVWGGDAFARKKPDPMPILKTCAALGVAPHRTLMVGDSANDAQAARAAGSPVVLVTYGYNHGEPIRQVDADGWLDSLAELAAL